MTLSQAQPHAFLRSLFQQINVFEDDFPSLESLQALGIQASQVSLDTEKHDTVKFDPCFFEPQPANGVLQRYPVDHTDSAGGALKLSPPLSVQDIMDRSLQIYPPGVAPIRENLTEEDRVIFETDPREEATELENFVHRHLLKARARSPSEETTLDRRTQCRWYPRHKEGDPDYGQAFDLSKWWELISHYRYPDLPRKPHSIISCVSMICPRETYCGVTTPELCAIACAMLLRVNHKPFSTCHIHPVLVLSYMGNRRARIIQALYDGKTLALQYSPFWNFADAERASLQVFVRYGLSKPVGGPGRVITTYPPPFPVT
ncbi:uncharacterized protein N7515_009052 [Penicillium bovifimosum]|uniref:Uncharacterized protein n=1 Tax=Penicillium bovifimosum TaxID=126998 RepID=A0A9W9GJ01_9EURO|nr:uncharacterized protein N7515_009052 [Penicillium bovifimosum]KAJ5121091.1 hypothetical protein N7515_009052 [Penicillium bovifimosum]